MRTIKDDLSNTQSLGSKNWFVDLYNDPLTYNEFNALVDELASNFGKCDISYQKHCSNEVTRLEGNEMKTVTHEGKAYQIGATYEFTDSDKGRHWELGILNDYASDEEGVGFQSKTGNKTEWFKHIRLQQAPVGTITEAPIELIDGAAYEFDYNNGVTGMQDAVMRYRKSGDCFYFGNTILERKHCTNIKLLTVEK